jgi:hypothetical protein
VDALSAHPPVPADVVVQLYVPGSGELYRVTDDGRFLVTPPGGEEEQRPPRSRIERGRQTLSTEGIERLRAALDHAGFFGLPERIGVNDCVPAGTVLPNSGRPVEPRPVVFAARHGDTVKTVEGVGDFGAPCTLGALEPVYRALDVEALGDWMKE